MTEQPSSDAVADELRRLGDRIDTLQDDVRRLSGPTLPPAEPGWGDDRSARVSYAWLSSLESPARRRPAVPRLLLEALFLAVCATAAALADLDAVALAGVMVGAWVLVALIEWASSRADRRRDELLSIPPPRPGRACARGSLVVRAARRADAARQRRIDGLGHRRHTPAGGCRGRPRIDDRTASRRVSRREHAEDHGRPAVHVRSRCGRRTAGSCRRSPRR